MYKRVSIGLSCVFVVGCGSAPRRAGPDQVAAASVSPCRDSDGWQSAYFAEDEGDAVAEAVFEAFGPIPPCLDAEGNDVECEPRVEVRFVPNEDAPAEHDLYILHNERIQVFGSVVGEQSGGSCGWEVTRRQRQLGPWIVASIAGTVYSFDEGCSDEGIGTALAIVDAKSGAFAGVVQCMGDGPAEPRLEGTTLVFDGCRGEQPRHTDAELRACIAR
jgi:hypothetical protein